MTDNYIRDASLLGEITGPVKSLTGFTRFHRPPEEHSPRARKFVQMAGTKEVADRAEKLFAAIRESFRYKRREISMTSDEGGATIETPDFRVTLTLDQDPEVASNFKLLTEVGTFRRNDVANTSSFIALFAPYCDTVVVCFGRPLDLEAKIDLIEENDDLAKCLTYDAACSWFRLRLPHLLVEVNTRRMTCKLPGDGNLAQLIAQSQAALERLSEAGFALER